MVVFLVATLQPEKKSFFLLRGNIQMAIFAASNQYGTHDENNRTHQKTQSRRLLVHGIGNKSRLVVEPDHAKEVPDSTPRHTRHRLDASERHRETIGGQVLTPFKNMKENRKMENIDIIISRTLQNRMKINKRNNAFFQ